MAPPQVQQPAQRVRCPACQTTLAPPPGAPIFRCPCGQHLRSPFAAAMSNAALAPKVSETDDKGATVASILQRRQDRSWARKVGVVDGRLHWIRLLTDAEESTVRQLEVDTVEKHTEDTVRGFDAPVLRDKLTRMGINVAGCIEKDDFVRKMMQAKDELKRVQGTELKRRLESIGVDYSNCEDNEELALRLFTAVWHEDAPVFREDGVVRSLSPDGKLLYVPASKYLIDNSAGKGKIIGPKDVLEISMKPFDKKNAWFKERLGELRTKWDDGHVRLRIRREKLLEDSFNSFDKLKSEDFLRFFRFEFIGEPGIDAGGVAREWFQLVGDACFNVDFGLFEYSGVDNVCYQINPNSGIANEVHLQYFRFLGRLMGKALFDGQTLSAHLAQPLYKHLLSWPLTEKDIEFVDAQVSSSFKDIRSCEDVSALCLDFTTAIRIFGETQTIELKPGGADIEVTNDNREEYLRLLFRHIMLDRVSEQLNEMLRGFYEVIPEGLLSVFDYQELELIINGLPNIDVNDWLVNTRYRGAYEEKKEGHKVIKWFWEMMKTLNEEQRARLLQFATGTSRVPVQGFAFLQGNVCFYYYCFSYQAFSFSQTAKE
jgi:hypothetical protein